MSLRSARGDTHCKQWGSTTLLKGMAFLSQLVLFGKAVIDCFFLFSPSAEFLITLFDTASASCNNPFIYKFPPSRNIETHWCDVCLQIFTYSTVPSNTAIFFTVTLKISNAVLALALFNRRTIVWCLEYISNFTLHSLRMNLCDSTELTEYGCWLQCLLWVFNKDVDVLGKFEN